MSRCLNCSEEIAEEFNRADFCEDCMAEYLAMDLEDKLKFHLQADLKMKGREAVK